MAWTRPLVGLLVLGVALSAAGSLAVLVGRVVLAGTFGPAPLLVAGLVAVAVAGTAALGIRSRERIENPGYW